VGLEINWNEVEALYDKLKMAPQVPSMASRCRARVSQRPSGRQGDVDDVVTDFEENDRAGVRRPREFSGRVKAQHRNDRRSRAPNSIRESRAAAVFNPARKMAVPVI